MFIYFIFFQGKPTSGSLKRKSDSNSANDEDGPCPPRIQPVRDHTSALPVNATQAGNCYTVTYRHTSYASLSFSIFHLNIYMESELSK